MHKCDNPPCVNPSHLWLGTCTDNNRDMIRKGRNRPVRGINVTGVKLTPEKVKRIRGLYAGGRRVNELGRLFGVSHTTIIDIVRRKNWAWVT